MSSQNLPSSADGLPGSKRRSISLVLPAWNEAEALPRAVCEADAALRAITDDYEILVVDDGSTDDTVAVVSELADRFPAARLIQHEENRGYGAALRSGFAAARGDLVTFTDADNQFDLTELDRFVLLAERYEIVCGYRIDRKDSFLRRTYSRGYNLLVRLLLNTGVRDIDCALKVFHRDVLQQLEITTDGFLVNSELLTQATQRGCTIVEVGVSHRPRTEGVSTVSVSHIPRVLTDLLRYWWNQVQFPGKSTVNEPSPAVRNRINWASGLLLLFAALLLLSNLGYPLIDRDETRYAEIPREMVTTGNWVLPQLNFRPYYDKPPLMYWLCSVSYSLLGVSEWSARLPHTLSCLGVLAATVLFARRWFGTAAGLGSGLVLLLSVGFLGSSRLLLLDGLLMLTTTLSLAFAFEAMRGVRFQSGWWLAACLACGAGFLTKGPIALVLLAPPVLAYSMLTLNASKPRRRDWLWMGGIVGAMSTPWLLAVSAQQPSFAYEFFYKHNVARFGGAFHVQPFWFFLPVVMVAGHPWSFLTVSYARFLGSRSEEDRVQRPPALGFLVLWAAWCVLFFSLSSCKLPSYILPALPAFAMMIGGYFGRLLLDDRIPTRFLERVAPWNAALVTACGGVGFALFCGLTGVETTTSALAVAVVWIVIGAGTMILRFRPVSGRAAWGVSLAMATLLGVTVTHRSIPQYARQQTLFGPGVHRLTGTDMTDSTVIATVSHEWAEAPFYLQRDDIMNLASNDTDKLERLLQTNGRLLLVMRSKDDPEALLSGLPEDVTTRLIAQRGPGQVLEVTAGPTSIAKRSVRAAARR